MNITTFEGGDGQSYLTMWVTGETGEREIVARHSCVNYLNSIHQISPDIAHMSFEELLKARLDAHVFRLPDGKQPPLEIPSIHA